MNPISNKYPETFGASLVVVVIVLRTDKKKQKKTIHTGASADDIITGAPNVRSDTRAAAVYMGPQGPSYIGRPLCTSAAQYLIKKIILFGITNFSCSPNNGMSWTRACQL